MAIFWTLIGVTAIIVTVLVVAANGRRSAEFAFTAFEPQSGWPDGWSFCIGLLQAAYGLSASGMVTSCVPPPPIKEKKKKKSVKCCKIECVRKSTNPQSKSPKPSWEE